MAQPQKNPDDGIITAFYVCTRSDGNCSPLSREELRQLMEQEFGEVMENPQDPKTVKKVLCFLDDNSNCRVDFKELLSLVFRVAKACYKPLQPHQAPKDHQELITQEKAAGEQLLGLREEGRVSHNLQVPEQDVSNQVQGTETQDPDDHQIQEGETSKLDPDTHQTQEGETSKQDRDTRQSPKGETSKQDQDTRQTQKGETPKWDPDNHQTHEAKEQDQDTSQSQEGERPEQDQEPREDGGTEAPEGDSERGEILYTAIPEQDRNHHVAEETETPKQDPKPHSVKGIDTPGQGSNYHQNPEMESEEQDLNCPSETQGRDPKNETQVCEAPQQDPNPVKTQKLPPPQWAASPRWDPKLQGSHHALDFHQLPEFQVLEQEHSETEDPSCPAQQQQAAHHPNQPAMEQQLLHPLYQWPPQQ
ncbi:cornulin-like [Heliangelus exortis]|uniref:cornulin-like n=1 Tax=Heliangelus exortis TaxID=472823 RepID=UPI003A92AD78